jgi:hypothetical protein
VTLIGRNKPAFDTTATYRAWAACAGANGEWVVVPGTIYPGTHPVVALVPHLFVPGDTLDEHLPGPFADIVEPGVIRQIEFDAEAA